MTSRGVPPLVLLVDDYADNREMYADFLRFSGFRAAEAADGHEALARVVELAPHVVVMDLSLPGIDGWEVTRRLRMDDRTKHIPIIALTGFALGPYGKAAKEAGCDVFLTKPCAPEALVAEIQRVLAGGGPSGPRKPAPVRSRTSRKGR